MEGLSRRTKVTGNVRKAMHRRAGRTVAGMHHTGHSAGTKSTGKERTSPAMHAKGGSKTSVPAKLMRVGKTDRKAIVSLEEKAHMEARMSNTKEFISSMPFLEFISRNVGTRANEIISTLIEGPLVDDKIAEDLSLKLNETRRMLNMLNSYGLVRYNINKNNEGWLSFVWYLDFESVKDLDARIKRSVEREVLPAGCNDFFMCPECVKTHNLALTFEVAFDNKFRCGCGKKLVMISRSEAETMYRTAIS